MPERSTSLDLKDLTDLTAEVLAMLACPVCFGALRMATSGERIVCAGCGRSYPVIDGIAVLIPERAAQGSSVSTSK